MVADQQGIGTVLSFGTKSVDPKVLEQLLIGREKDVDHLFQAIKAIVQNGNNQQILLIGQRGMGKTHLLRILYERSQTFIKKGQLVVAYFSEDEYGIASYFDFLTRVLGAFMRWNQTDAKLLQQKLEELQNTSNAAQTRFIQKIISNYVAGRPLLILAENFGDILDGIGPQEQGKLRAWLYENPRISLIATSQSISADFDKEDRPFYGFFQLNYLKPLSFEDSERFLIQLAKLDGRDDIVQHLLNKGKAQVRAIHELVKGNHRLLVTFYEFLKSDVLAKLSSHFIKTINDLKPYYETYIRYLPPQQQKILRYIALARKPQQGTVISKNCFIDQKSLSKQLNELARKRLVEVIPDEVDKRNKLYDINEPLLRISIEIGEHKEGITALFVDFLALYYDNDELEKKRLKFMDLLEKCLDLSEQRTFQYEIQAIERALTLKTFDSELSIFKKFCSLIGQLQMAEALEVLESQRGSLSGDAYRHCLSLYHLLQKEYNSVVKLFSQMSSEFLRERKMYTMWGYGLLQLSGQKHSKRLLQECLKKFEEAMKYGEDNAFLYINWGVALRRLANLKGDGALLSLSVEKLKEAIEYDNQNGEGFIELATSQAAISIMNADGDIALAALDNLRMASSLHSDELNLLIVWGGVISFTSRFLDKDISGMNIFKEKLARLPVDIRMKAWRSYSTLKSLYLFKEVFSLLKADILQDADPLRSILIEWINYLLAENLQSLRTEDLAYLREAIGQIVSKIPELEISLHYIDIFEKYVIDKNKNAIYELPKEQRLFFLKYIIKEEIEKTFDK